MDVIVDGNHLAHRCRHVFSLSNKGVDTSVTYGFLRVLSTMLTKFKPKSVVVCWDGGVPEFRRKVIPEYKSTRDHGDPLEYEDFLRQMNELRDYALPMMGVLSVQKAGAEADDLMYHASRIMRFPSVIVTGDKDLLQAINDKVKVYNPTKDKVYNREEFQKEYGIPINLYIDWRALQGDSSDDIKGVPGIGEKTATKLFNEYGTLTQITNAAAGRNPNKVLTGRLAESICSFGFDHIARNIFVMALYADRVGAKAALYDAQRRWIPANTKRIKKYFLRNAFMSLVDGNFMENVNRLRQPVFADPMDVRTPVISGIRKPVL